MTFMIPSSPTHCDSLTGASMSIHVPWPPAHKDRCFTFLCSPELQVKTGEVHLNVTPPVCHSKASSHFLPVPGEGTVAFREENAIKPNVKYMCWR